MEVFLENMLYEELWKACAGPLLEIPMCGEQVYYFPQGHSEQLESSTSDEANQPEYDLPSKILCRLINIQLRAEQDTDDVYAQITLVPEVQQIEPSKSDPYPAKPPRANVHWFCKVLTASDMSSRYGLCIPRKHATKCLPPLDMSQETPAQKLVARDLHGNEWHFKHTFRGQPPRHLLTTGWSAFVSSKRLIAGDTVIFVMRAEGADMCIGVKRLVPPQRSLTLTGVSSLTGVKNLAHPQSSIPSTGISSRNIHQELLAAAYYALCTGTMFTIYWKPRLKGQFIITANKYLEALSKKFCIGMRIKMPFQGEDSLEKSFTGTIVEIGDICRERWPNSEWRCLKIRWDESASITRPDKVSPWEIEPFVNLVPRSSIQIGGMQNYTEMPQPVLKKRGKKRKLQDESKNQVVKGLDTVVSPHPRPKRASLEDLYERLDGRCPTTIESCSELGLEKGTGEQNVTPANQDSTNQGEDGSEDCLADLLNANLVQDEMQRQPQGTLTNQAAISDNNYADQLGDIYNLGVQHFTFPDNILASEGSDEAWITNLFEGVNQEEHEPEGEISTHLQPLPENTCHVPLQGTLPLACQPGSSNIRHISSTCLIPHDGPDPGDELVAWSSYLIPRRCIPILDRIIARYPELLSSFRATSKVFQSMSLQILAEVVYMLEHLTVGSINQDQLDDSKRHLNDLKMSGIQVDWIESRLLQIEAVFKKAMLVQRREKLILEVDSVDEELEEVTSIIGTNPLNADHSLMQGLL